MTLEDEFNKSYKKFHDDMDKSKTLFDLYMGKSYRSDISTWYSSAPIEPERIIKPLKITNPEVLKLYEDWKNPRKSYDSFKKVSSGVIKTGKPPIQEISYVYYKCSMLAKILRDLEESLTKKVLLEQAIVTSCTAYECYLKEQIPWLLKYNEDSARRFLGALNKPIKEAGKYNFDLMGNVDKIYKGEFENKLMPVFPDVLTFYNDVFKIKLFKNKKEKKYVEKIFQMRHCIIHNGGKPDSKWRQKTKGAKYILNKDICWKYITKIHLKLHDIAHQIAVLLDLDMNKIWPEVDVDAPKDLLLALEQETAIIYDDKLKKWRYVELSGTKK